MVKKILKKSFIYFVLLFFAKVLTALFFIAIARIFGPNSFGKIVFFITISQISVAIFDFGLREFYQKNAHIHGEQLFKTCFFQRLKLLLINLLLIGLANFIFKFNSLKLICLILTIGFESVLSICDSYYLFLKKSQVVAYKLLSRNLLLFIFLGILIFPTENINFFFITYVLANFLVMIFYIPWNNLFKHKLLNLDKKYSWSFVFLNLLSMAYSKSDSLIIKFSLGDLYLGFYGAAYRYLESINLFSTSIAHNLFPIVSKKNNFSLKSLLKMVAFMFGISLFCSSFLFFGADFLTVGLLGQEYLPSKIIVQIFSILVILFFVNSPLISTISASGQLKDFLPWAGLNTLFNIVANLLVVGRFGMVGVAIVMILSEILAGIINIIFIRKIYAQKRG
jgi:O-antigen/teichoic acid export membrane protein